MRSIFCGPPKVSSRSRYHASSYSPYFDFSNSGCSPILHIPFTIFTGRMYHKSSGITYAATKSNGFPRYGPRLSFSEHEYPSPSWNIVDFTCTRTIRPFRCSTVKSYPVDSPQGRPSGRPNCIARTAKHNSAHSPRLLPFLIFIPAFLLFMIFLSALGGRAVVEEGRFRAP